MTERWLNSLDRIDATRTAVVDGTGQLTYGELRAQARRQATALCDRHGSGEFLIVRASSSASLVRTLLAIMFSGNVPVPVDPSLPTHALEYIRDKSRAVEILDPLPAPDPNASETDRYATSRPALVVFTSGTSGFPKGVVVSDANLSHSCRAIARYLDYVHYPSAAVTLPLFYSYALISQVLCQLSIGGRVRLFEDLRNPAKFEAAVEAEGLQTFCGVPSTFQALGVFAGLRPISMPAIRVVCSAGAAMDAGLLGTVRTVFPNATLFNNYGMTEASPRIAFVRDDDARFAEATCGRPIEGVEVKVIDPATEQTVPDGTSGVLAVRGPNVTSGYLNDPELTRQAFTADGYLKSGDLAYLDDGYIFIQGRYDDVFNCGGEKIAPLEIERALNSCPGIEAAAVAGLPDVQRGTVPVAFVKTSGDLTRQEIVRHLSQYVSRSKIPLRFYRVSAFPMTSNGKLQRQRLSASDDSYVIGELR
jgi:acyl-CoA synthetase (AMP-forming)/AMP-acid ligase II